MILNNRIPLKYWFHKVKWDLLLVTVFSVAIFFFKKYIYVPGIPVSIGTFLGTAIALLLSFKLAQSYDRWWEARKIWGAIVNDSRSLVMQLKHFTDTENMQVIRTMAYRQIAWCYALSRALRNQDPFNSLHKLLTDVEMEALKQEPHVPLALLDFHTGDVLALQRSGQLNDFQQVQIDSTIVRLTASMGKAERIKNTIFPKTYRVVLHLFIYIFLVLLSLSLTNIGAYIEIPLLIAIALPFFLLEKIAFTIQDPFDNRPTDISMTHISETIERNIKQLLEEEVPAPTVVKGYYVM